MATKIEYVKYREVEKASEIFTIRRTLIKMTVMVIMIVIVYSTNVYFVMRDGATELFTISMWMLIVDNKPMFRTEFPHMITDDETRLLHRGSQDLFEVLEKNKDSLLNSDTHHKNIDDILGKILKDIDWKGNLNE